MVSVTNITSYYYSDIYFFGDVMGKEIVDGFYRYREDLIKAVEFLMRRGITRSGEIARRLGISPFTVRNIKLILRRRKAREEKKEKEKSLDVLEEILGGE